MNDTLRALARLAAMTVRYRDRKDWGYHFNLELLSAKANLIF